MFIVWHFREDKTLPQLQGVFSTEEKAQECCNIGDCYHYIEVDRNYIEDIETDNITLFKTPSGKFKSNIEYAKELDESVI